MVPDPDSGHYQPQAKDRHVTHSWAHGFLFQHHAEFAADLDEFLTSQKEGSPS